MPRFPTHPMTAAFVFGAIFLTALVLVSGCTTPGGGAPPTAPTAGATITEQQTGTSTEVTSTAAVTPGTDSGGFVYNADEASSGSDQAQVTMYTDTPATTVPLQTLTDDHDDMGDILP